MNPSEHVYYHQVIQDIALIVSLQKRDAREADLDTPAAKIQRYLLNYPEILFGGEESYGTPAKELMGVMTSFSSALSAAASAVSVALGFFTKSTASELDSISVLPPEIMLNIFKNLPLIETARLCSVNHAFRDLSKYAMVKKINDPHFSLRSPDFRDKNQVISFLRSLGADNRELITHLNLIYISIDDDFLKQLSTLTPNLQSLNISRIGGGVPISFLTKFNLSRLRLTNEGLKALAPLKGLKNLNLSGCTDLTNDGLACLALFEQLECLDLECSWRFTARGLTHITHVRQLKKLSLADCKHVNDDCLTLLTLLTELSDLNLSNCQKITHHGLAQLVALKKLESLDLSRCPQLTDDDLACLAQLRQLISLDLSSSKLTDAGLAHLGKLIRLENLKLLGCVLITDEGILYLVQLTQLKMLNLINCWYLTDKILSYLALLMQLQHLELYGCKLITNAAKKHLMDQVPNLVIK